MDRIVCLLIVLLVAFCSTLSFVIGRMMLRRETMKDIQKLHTDLSGIENAEYVGVVLPQELRFRICDTVKSYMKEHFPDELIDAIDDYVDARIWLEDLED